MEKPAVSVSENKTLVGKRILLVEDNALNQEIAIRLLESRGIEVVSAENGQIGLEKFEASALHYYDAILMDIRMPVMNGYQATSAIRSLTREDGKSIPIIAMTADAFADDAEKARATGMNAHIAKPIDPSALFALLSKVIVER